MGYFSTILESFGGELRSVVVEGLEMRQVGRIISVRWLTIIPSRVRGREGDESSMRAASFEKE